MAMSNSLYRSPLDDAAEILRRKLQEYGALQTHPELAGIINNSQSQPLYNPNAGLPPAYEAILNGLEGALGGPARGNAATVPTVLPMAPTVPTAMPQAGTVPSTYQPPTAGVQWDTVMKPFDIPKINTPTSNPISISSNPTSKSIPVGTQTLAPNNPFKPGQTAYVTPSGESATATDRLNKSGSRNWRNNNPGNIVAGSFSKKTGAVGSDGKFAIYPDYSTGRAAVAKLLTGNSYSNLSIIDAIGRYAPGSDGNNPQAYAANISKMVGVPVTTKLNQLDAKTLDKVVSAIQHIEGWKPGKTGSSVGTITGSRSGELNPVDLASNSAPVNPVNAGSGYGSIIGSRANYSIPNLQQAPIGVGKGNSVKPLEIPSLVGPTSFTPTPTTPTTTAPTTSPATDYKSSVLKNGEWQLPYELGKRGNSVSIPEQPLGSKSPITLTPNEIKVLRTRRADGNEHVDELNPTFAKAIAKLLQDRPGLSINSGFRTKAEQTVLWNKRRREHPNESEAQSRKWVALPGNSRHEKSTAVDLKFASKADIDWVHANASRYGLVFPLSNENWHIELAGTRGKNNV